MKTIMPRFDSSLLLTPIVVRPGSVEPATNILAWERNGRAKKTRGLYLFGLRVAEWVTMLVLLTACGPETIVLGEGSGETGDAGDPGYLWGPCPTDEETGVHDLCFEPGTACVPSDEATACLQLSECPENPGFGGDLELGYGDVCYPRCSVADDCIGGMACTTGAGEIGSFCAWPM